MMLSLLPKIFITMLSLFPNVKAFFYENCNGVQYNFYDDICCSGVITTGIVGFNKDYFESYGTACCGTVGYDINDGLCCDGTVNTGLSAFNSDTCPSGGSGSGGSSSGSGGSGSSGSGSGGSGSSSSGGNLGFTCYPNETIVLTNPDSSTYTHVVAVEDEGTSSATDCSVSLSGTLVEITSCDLDQDITVHFSDRDSTASADNIFGGSSVDSYVIHCDQIQDTGISRTVADSLAATLETSTEADVTPSFSVTTDLRTVSETGSSTSSADVADVLYWTIDVPSDYYARPSCTAYSGTDATGDSKTMFSSGCSSDADIAPSAFTSTTTVGLKKRYFTSFYVFKFYDNDDVFFRCDVLVCPQDGSANCAASCTKKRRSISNATLADGSRYFEASKLLHVTSPGSGATAVLGYFGLVLLPAMILLQ